MIGTAAVLKARQAFFVGEAARVGFCPAIVQKSAVSVRCGAAARPLGVQIRAMSRSALDDMKDGEFKRAPTSYRSAISSEPGAEFPPEAGRYHLYISYACPWASRCFMFLKLKGLEDAIGISITKAKWEKTKEDPSDGHSGWAFASVGGSEAGATDDTINGANYVRDLYELVDPSYTGRFTVPILWDKKKKTIVNNESSEITKLFNNEFNKVAKHPEVNLFPPQLIKQIDEVNSWTYNGINNGVYRAGFATKQEPYTEAVTELFQCLDRAEEILSKQRYIAGDAFTEADVRLFVTLIRFDEVYVVHFKCNRTAIREYPNLFNYVKEIYQIAGISDTVNMTHIKQHYYGSHPTINKYGIIPLGPNIDYNTPHDRGRFAK